MAFQRWWRMGLVLAILLAGLIPGRVQAASNLGQYISPDFSAAIVIHPERIGKSTLAEAIKKGLPKELAEQESAMDLGEALSKVPNLPKGIDAAKLGKALKGKSVVRVVVVVDPMPSADLPAGVAMIAQFGSDIQGDELLSALGSEWKPGNVDGTAYKKMKNPEEGAPDIAASVPDERTLILGVEVSVVKMLAKQKGPRPLLDKLQRVSFDNDILVVFLAGPTVEKVAKGTGKTADQLFAGLGNPALVELAKDIKSLSVTLNFSGKTLCHAEVQAGKKESAAMLLTFAMLGVKGGKDQFEELKKNPPPMLPPPLAPAINEVGDEVFQSLKITTEGTNLVIDLPMPKSLPKALTTAAEIAGALAAAAKPPAN